MESFALTKNSNFNDIEDAFKILEDSDSLTLRLPNGLKEAGVFGFEGLTCQLLATWLRNNKNGNLLHSYATQADPQQFEDLSSKLYGLCALRLADKILLADKTEVDQKVALGIAFERVRKILAGDFSTAFKGLYVAIPAIKSPGVNKEYNNPLYYSSVNNGKTEYKVIGEDAFRALTERALAVVVPQVGRDAYIKSLKRHIAEIIRELFDNTDKHARENERGDVLATNFRGVIFNSVNLTPKRLTKLVSSAGGGDMLLFSADWKGWMEANNKNLPVLDITVVDAGPGYAKRWTSKPKQELTIEDEVAAVLECFVKNNSTSPNNADGSGLTHVLSDLRRLRGWFRLRTGAVAVSRSYFSGMGSLEITDSDVKEMNSHIEGTSFNIVIPLVDINKEVK